MGVNRRRLNGSIRHKVTQVKRTKLFFSRKSSISQHGYALVSARGREQHQVFVTKMFISNDRVCLMNRGSLLKTKPVPHSTSSFDSLNLRSNHCPVEGSFGRPERTFTCQQAQERSLGNSWTGRGQRTRREVWGVNRLQWWGKELGKSRGKIKAKKSGWPKGDGSILLFLCTPAYLLHCFVARMTFSSLLGSPARMWHVLETFVIIFVSRFVSSANLHFFILVRIAVTDLFLKEPSFA